MTTTVSPQRATPRVADASRLPWAVVAVALAGTIAVYARLRWPGLLPLGSDNDEYLLVGQALARFEAPVVAGVEGTKYPLGYPLVLAVFEWLGLRPASAAMVLNLAALTATVATMAWLAGRATDTRPASPGAALAAGGLVATSVAVWNDVFSVMPEILLLTVVTAMLVSVERQLDRRRLVWLTALAVAAVLLKSLALLLVVGGSGLVWLVALRRPEAVGVVRGETTRLLAPVAAAGAVVVAGFLAMRRFPEHTTGYFATFRLADPDDASLGELGVAGLVERTIRDVPDTLTDLGRAIALVESGRLVAVTVAIVALTVGVIGAARLRPGTPLAPFAAGMAIAYAAGMSTWPYHSSRFGIPLVPIAALGLGWVVRSITTRRWASLGIGAVVLAALVATSASGVLQRGEQAREDLARHHTAMEELHRWAEHELGDGEALVSFDYREISRALDRPVDPVAYTSDPDALLQQVEGADRFVVMDIYNKRSVQARALLRAYPDQFELVYETDGAAVYEIRR